MPPDDDRSSYAASYSVKLTAKKLASFTPDELRRIFPNGILGGNVNSGAVREAEAGAKRRAFRVIRGGKLR